MFDTTPNERAFHRHEEPVERVEEFELPPMPSIREQVISPQGNAIYCERRGLIHECSSALDEEDSLELLESIGRFSKIVVNNSSAIIGDNFVVMKRRNPNDEMSCNISEDVMNKVLKC